VSLDAKWNFAVHPPSKAIILRSLYSSQLPQETEAVVHSSVLSRNGKRAAAFVGALIFAWMAAGCHGNNLTSGFGIGWVTLTDEPSNFASYVVEVVSVVMTGVNDGAVTVLDVPEVVDFTKITNISELWGSASIPTDQYTSAIITLDYTYANISVIGADGVPQQAKVVDSNGQPFTSTISVTVNFDPVNQAYSIPTYATTSGIRIALDFDMAASNRVNLATSPATVSVAPYFTVATSASDQKPILVRGPLVNTSVNEQTYSVYVRPFYDEVNTAGTLTMFNNVSVADGAALCPQNNPVYTINGTAYPGNTAIGVLSQTSAGSTMTQAVTTYHPTVTPSATAAVFCVNYMIGGSTLEDFYTFGLEGDVIARNGNTLTVRGPTLFLNANDIVNFLPNDYHVTLGTGTSVTQDAAPSDAGLNYKSVSVGQHIIARGVCPNSANPTPISVDAGSSTNGATCPSVNGFATLDATGTSATNTGSVRILPTQAFGTLVSTATGSLTMDLANLNQYPASAYNFAGTGTSTATDAVPASYVVDTGALTLPADLTAGGPAWVDGIVGPYGSAPPDFTALDVVDEVSEPATLVVEYIASALNHATAFTTLTDTGIGFNLTDNLLASAQIQVGAEVIDLTTLPASPTIVPVAVTTPVPPPIKVATSGLTSAQLPPTFLPLFCSGSSANGILCYNGFSQFVVALNSSFGAATPASVYAVTARGSYDRVNNTFTAAAIDVVLD
jgi:hypothetical protein